MRSFPTGTVPSGWTGWSPGLWGVWKPRSVAPRPPARLHATWRRVPLTCQRTGPWGHVSSSCSPGPSLVRPQLEPSPPGGPRGLRRRRAVSGGGRPHHGPAARNVSLLPPAISVGRAADAPTKGPSGKDRLWGPGSAPSGGEGRRMEFGAREMISGCPGPAPRPRPLLLELEAHARPPCEAMCPAPF